MAKSNSKGALIVVLVVLAVAAAGGWYFWTQKSDRPPEFNTTKITRGDVMQVVTASGDIQPVTSVDVSSQVSGLIKEVLVDYNSPVKQGDVLAKLDPATYEQRLKQADADLQSTVANNTLARINFDRVRELRKKELVSQQELDQAEAQLAQSNAQLLTRQASVEDAKVNLGRCTIYAPIDGLVMSKVAEVGKTVAASLNAPTLFIIANELAKMQISAAVAEADIGNVENGQDVNFTVDAFPNRQFKGKVIQIRNSPKNQQGVVTYECIIAVNNDDLKLKPGMTANVSIIIAQRNGVLKVPNAALRLRVPEELQPPKKTDAATGAAGTKSMSDEERRTAMREIMREAGISPGSPPSPQALAKAQELAKAKGIEIDFARFGRGGGGGGGRGGERGERSGQRAGQASNAPVSRTVYKLIKDDPEKPRLEALTAKLGITDGISTELIEGAAEGDLIVTSIIMPNAKSGSTPGSSPNPFSPGGYRRH